jgi:mono/diheme cytochrome c family protein
VHPNVFVAFIRNPKMPDGSAGSMPAFPSAQISDREAESLYEYIVQTMGYPTRK